MKNHEAIVAFPVLSSNPMLQELKIPDLNDNLTNPFISWSSYQESVLAKDKEKIQRFYGRWYFL